MDQKVLKFVANSFADKAVEPSIKLNTLPKFVPLNYENITYFLLFIRSEAKKVYSSFECY